MLQEKQPPHPAHQLHAEHRSRSLSHFTISFLTTYRSESLHVALDGFLLVAITPRALQICAMHPRMQNAVLRLYLAMFLLGVQSDDDDEAAVVPLEEIDRKKSDEIGAEASEY